MGVALEKLGRRAEAREQYEKAAQRFPKAHDPVFNLGVLAWQDQNWAKAADYFQETMNRKPDHMQAAGFYAGAMERMKK